MGVPLPTFSLKRWNAILRDLHECEAFIRSLGLPPIPEEDLSLPSLNLIPKPLQVPAPIWTPVRRRHQKAFFTPSMLQLNQIPHLKYLCPLEMIFFFIPARLPGLRKRLPGVCREGSPFPHSWRPYSQDVGLPWCLWGFVCLVLICFYRNMITV